MSPAQSASRIGKAAEYLVASSCILMSDTALNVSTSLVDDEGVDLVFHRRDKSTTLAVQVKSRTFGGKGLAIRSRFHAPVRSATFRPRPDLYMLFVPIDALDASFPFVWLVPSETFGSLVGAPNSRGDFIFVASAKPTSSDRWSKFKCNRGELSGELMTILDSLAPGDAC
jgi:hypothetical protein